MYTNEKEREALLNALTGFIDSSRTQTQFPTCMYCGAGVTLDCRDDCVVKEARNLRLRIENYAHP